MATWKAQNSMLTQKGVEILNKVKAGIGTITVSRVVAGSGRVAESMLYLQETVSGTQKPMAIYQKQSYETGSEISVNITNAGYTESFSLQQIGVYVTHPEYAGEQLYHISQCDEVGHDLIPVPSDGPASFAYTLYLEHDNSSSISITLDPEGMLPARDFEDFKSSAVVGDLLVLDSNGKLKSTGKSLAKLFNKNLLHNWYFKNPVDQKQGFVVPPNIPYYSDVALTTRIGATTGYYKAAKVNATYSTVQIGSSTHYVATSSLVRGYISSNNKTIDRWYISDGVSASYLLVQNDGIKIGLGYTYGIFTQDVGAISSAHFEGLTFTLSVNITSLMGGASPSLYVSTGDEVFYSPVITKTGISSFTFTVPMGASEFAVGLRNNQSSGNSVITLTAMKLEIGTVSSLENDPPADFAEQMAICIQYDPSTGSYRGFPVATTNTLAVANVTEE